MWKSPLWGDVAWADRADAPVSDMCIDRIVVTAGSG
jgi:hypothetical protein